MKLFKIIITIFVFLFSFSSLSFGEWEKVTQSRDKVLTLYLDYTTLKNVDGYTLIWSLDDLSKEDEYGIKSYITYNKVDCKLYKMKKIIIHLYECPMGDCTPKHTDDKEDIKWDYPIPQTYGYRFMNGVCKRK